MDITDRHDLENSVPFYAYYQELMRLKSAHQGLEGMFCAGFFSDEGTALWDSVRCPAGTTKLSIAADGAVYPCYLFFRYPEFELGNILRDDFQKIWQSPVLNYFRTFTKNKCPDTACTLSTACHGGCPAMSYMFFHDLDAPDPRCSSSLNAPWMNIHE